MPILNIILNSTKQMGAKAPNKVKHNMTQTQLKQFYPMCDFTDQTDFWFSELVDRFEELQTDSQNWKDVDLKNWGDLSEFFALEEILKYLNEIPHSEDFLLSTVKNSEAFQIAIDDMIFYFTGD